MTSVPTLTFFNNKGGVGKTTLVYHLSWMFAELGVRTLVVDCDPQANLTAAFVDEATLSNLWNPPGGDHSAGTIYEAVRPLTRIGDFAPPDTIAVDPRLQLIAGDLGLSAFEDQLSEQWTKALGDDTRERAMLVLSAFWRMAQAKAKEMDADLVIFDVGPNLGAINRSVLIGTDHVVVPLAADLFSLQGLRNLGPALVRWRNGWAERKLRIGDAVGSLPAGEARPAGYIALQHQERLSRPVQAYVSWLGRIPGEYRQHLLQEQASGTLPDIKNDPYCLALLRHYKSLIPFSQEARKPVFKLRSADGAIGSHAAAVTRAYQDFHTLALKILSRVGVTPA
ncbi:ParA family protein [Paracidovorax cattleyae]|uniref:CobQ/CobB/MinD/ParA nucleotide binding domain-containing protein n=1 Tax=Paracidovorax cattleyae TaxID=80868 RepID=A0A1H0U032_9BURK|nr:AAA family ATPase [Paracidovorax cattleyae]AVS72855.1 chromosome partitioning protein [Paracidovorax cattleyae]MBF9265583.1 ParA family protein [Paracidovorax cattleyae]SDP59176.1 CobQ/CobB/MinD/ParA nucleotide binding domain-containing protein [Paracidovorax cattleyae]